MTVNYTIHDHPLLLHKLSYLRQPDTITHSRDYERLIYEMGLILTSEITRNDQATLKTKWVDQGQFPKQSDWCGGEIIETEPLIVAVVRAGLTIAQASRDILQTPYMAHIGVFEQEKQPGSGLTETKPFMVTIPEDIKDRKVFIFDLFMVRGKTAEHVILQTKSYGAIPDNIHYVSLVISPEAYSFVDKNNICEGVNFHCVRVDGEISEDRWLNNLQDTYHRLYRTTNRPDYTGAGYGR